MPSVRDTEQETEEQEEVADIVYCIQERECNLLQVPKGYRELASVRLKEVKSREWLIRKLRARLQINHWI